jgi:hypothetical protein
MVNTNDEMNFRSPKINNSSIETDILMDSKGKISRFEREGE